MKANAAIRDKCGWVGGCGSADLGTGKARSLRGTGTGTGVIAVAVVVVTVTVAGIVAITGSGSGRIARLAKLRKQEDKTNKVLQCTT